MNLFHLLAIPRWTNVESRLAYLDVGAHHPLNISNTALLYLAGYQGVLVEANPYLIADLKVHRPKDVTLNIGVAPVSGRRTFYMIDPHSGRNTFSREEADKFVTEHPEFKITEHREIEVMTLDDVVKKCQNGWPYLLSLDIEGLDFACLSQTNLFDGEVNKSPWIVCIEVGMDDPKGLKMSMNDKGYFTYCRMGANLIFLNDRVRRFAY